MNKLLTTLTWNIGAAKLLTPDADATLMASYQRDGIEEIADKIKNINADIVALQEVERKDGYDQAEIIAKRAGYDYYFHDSTSDSHIDTDCKLGHAILSKYPISNHKFGLFENPNITITWEDGSKATSFDKGFSTCTITINDTDLLVATLHLIPFSRFAIELDSDQAQQILSNVSSSLKFDTNNLLIMGDFNINDSRLRAHLPTWFEDYRLSEVIIDNPTTPKGRHYDHVLFCNLSLQSKQIDSTVLTDHYPVLCEFTVAN